MLDGQTIGSRGDIENTLDLETTIGLAYGLTEAILYTSASSVQSAMSQALSENKVDTLSVSYNWNASSSDWDLIQQATTQGITFMSASGDSGSIAVGNKTVPATRRTASPSVERTFTCIPAVITPTLGKMVGAAVAAA